MTSTASATDLVSLSDFKEHLNWTATSTSSDSELYLTLHTVTQGVERLIGSVVARTESVVRMDGGREYLLLPHRPVYAFITVVEWSGSSSTSLTAYTPATSPANGYYYDDNDGGKLYRTSGATRLEWLAGFRNVEVTYQSGRCVNTAATPEHIAWAAKEWAAHLWRATQHGGRRRGQTDSDAQASGFGYLLPNRVREVLEADPYYRP